jgi:hypothetical protein
MAVIKIVPMPGAVGDKGDEGAVGPQGQQGPAGQNGLPGTPALWSYQGTYNSSAAYAVGDVVVYQGQLYYTKSVTTAGTLPTDTAKFDLIASKGADGTNGTNGTNGANGLDGKSSFFLGTWDSVTHFLSNHQGGPTGLADGDWWAFVKDNTNPNKIYVVREDPLSATGWVIDNNEHFILPQGPQGDPGEQGVPGTAGAGFGIFYLGNYNPSSGYVPDIAVVRGSDGQLYLAKASGQLGDPVGNTAQWEVWIPKGQDGAPGTNGADALWNFTGAWVNGIDYAAGSVVEFQGSTYYHPHGQFSSYSPPTNGWLLVAEKGEPGTDVFAEDGTLYGPTNFGALKVLGLINSGDNDLGLYANDANIILQTADGKVDIVAPEVNIVSNVVPSSFNINTYLGASVNSNRTSTYAVEDKVVATLGDINSVDTLSNGLTITGYIDDPAVNPAGTMALAVLDGGYTALMDLIASAATFNGNVYITNLGNDKTTIIETPTTINDNLSVNGSLNVSTGATGTFETPDSKLVTVTNGIITSIAPLT